MGKKHLSLTDRAETALEKGADEADMTLSEYASKAIIEYSDRDRAARMEEKLDEVLDRLDAPKADGGTVSENPVQKEKNRVPADAHTFDPSDYDPEADRDPLSKDELKQLLKEVDEPVINPDHVDDDTMSIRSNDQKQAAVAAIIRYDRDQEEIEVVNGRVVEDYVRDYLGSSDYILSTHPEGIIDHFYPYEYLTEADSGYGFEKSGGAYYYHRSDWSDHLNRTLDPIRETADQPFTVVSDGFGDSWEPSYVKMRKWLASFQQDLMDADLSSTEEINSLIDDLNRQQNEVNESLAELEDEFKEGVMSKAEFTAEEAAETLDCDTEDVEGLMTISINRGLAEETEDGYKITR